MSGKGPLLASSTHIVLIFLLAVVLGTAPARGQSTTFSYGNFGGDVSTLAFRGQAHQAFNSVLALTQETPGSCGKAVLSTPLQLIQSRNGVCSPVSFNTTFAFRRHGYGRQCLADGLTMLITPQVELPAAGCSGGSGLGYRGEPANSFAVEFDISQNADSGDIDGNHVGLNSGGSTVSTTANSLVGMVTLADMSLKRVWVDYDSISTILTVRVSYDEMKPEQPVVYKTVDMCQVLGQNAQLPFYVGFSASTGLCFGRHDIVSWAWTHAGSVFTAGAQTFATPAVGAGSAAAVHVMAILASFISALYFQIWQ